MKGNIELIAEIAQGFEGNEKLTELLVQGAIAADADAIKFQLVIADELCTPDYKHYDLFQSLEMDEVIWRGVCSFIHKKGKKVYFDVFGPLSLEIAKRVGADGVKISTTEFYNNQLFESAISLFSALYLSVGGIPIEDVDKKLSGLNAISADKICLMYGFQAEPTPLEQNNLLKLKLLKKRYPQYKIGFMDHSDGGLDEAFHLSLVSIGFGIDVIEKHITLDRELEIEDFVSGLTPKNFFRFVELIRKYEKALGDESLKLSEAEREYSANATKSVVAIKDIESGKILTLKDVALKRSSIPLTKNSIMEIEAIIGKELKVDVGIHTPIIKDYL